MTVLYLNPCYNKVWERSGSVVECLIPDRGATGSSLTGLPALYRVPTRPGKREKSGN